MSFELFIFGPLSFVWLLIIWGGKEKVFIVVLYSVSVV